MIPTIDEIEDRADALDVSLRDLAKLANVSVWTVRRYKAGATDPLRKLKALDAALRKLEAA